MMIITWLSEKRQTVGKYLPRIIDSNPGQCMAIADNLQRLGEMERANELNPDCLPTALEN